MNIYGDVMGLSVSGLLGLTHNTTKVVVGVHIRHVIGWSVLIVSNCLVYGDYTTDHTSTIRTLSLLLSLSETSWKALSVTHWQVVNVL